MVEEHIRLHVGFSLSLILGCEQCGTGVQLWLLRAWGDTGRCALGRLRTVRGGGGCRQGSNWVSSCPSVLLALWAELGALSPDTDIVSWEMAIGTQDPLSLVHLCRCHRGSRKGSEELVWFRTQYGGQPLPGPLRSVSGQAGPAWGQQLCESRGRKDAVPPS